MRPSLRGEQWGRCYVCGELFPLSLLTERSGSVPSGTYTRTDPDVVVHEILTWDSNGKAATSSTSVTAGTPATDETPKGICEKCKDEG